MSVSVLVTEKTMGVLTGLDEEAGVIRGAKIIGLESVNGHDYSKEGLRKAVPLYEECDVNIDHVDEKKLKDRKTIEGWGVVRNARHESDGNYGDIHYLKSHPDTPWILERIQKFPNKIGLSHVASVTLARTTKGRKKLVESVNRVVSVDIVSRPATTKGIFESENRTVKVKVKSFAEKATNEKVKALLESAEESLEFESVGDDALDLAAATLAAVESAKDTGNPQTPPLPASPANTEANAGAEQLVEHVKTLQESVAYLIGEQRKVQRDAMIRTVLESFGFTIQDLSPERQQLIAKMPDEESVKQLVATFPPASRGARRTMSESQRASPSPGWKPAENFQELMARCS